MFSIHPTDGLFCFPDLEQYRLLHSGHLSLSELRFQVRGADASDCIIKTQYGDVLPSNKELSGASVELVDMDNREYVLKTRLLSAKETYDYIFIDCPPSLELLTVNALAAADSVLIPVQCEYYALEGIADLMTTIKLTKKRLNPSFCSSALTFIERNL